MHISECCRIADPPPDSASLCPYCDVPLSNNSLAAFKGHLPDCQRTSMFPCLLCNELVHRRLLSEHVRFCRPENGLSPFHPSHASSSQSTTRQRTETVTERSVVASILIGGALVMGTGLMYLWNKKRR
ncbi:unnamed protein product [Protopolystoma xenopodis]|uniref:Uncharacterized protein n=1 Tax=Protopolystoma xenopodis TaxID=117903 RepID=A0A3S5AKM3_9PLAT|nr:unnamed protein product [Protopolystoma xenopodis]